jgi:low affinity Fe/Cu permease
MQHINTKKFSIGIENFSSACIRAAGSSFVLAVAFGLVILWAFMGFFFHFSEKWELIIGTLSNVVTFLMVFLIQKSQNKDSLAIQLKLNELVAAHGSASNRLVNVEGMTEEELKVIRKYYHKLGEFAKQEDTLLHSHSIDEKHVEHEFKKEMEEELKKLDSTGTPKV